MNKVLSTLGLARRAGRLTYGFDMVLSQLHKTYLILLAEDASERTCRNVREAAEEFAVPVMNLPYTKESLGISIGTKPVGILGVVDRGFAKSLTKSIEGGK